MADLVPSTVVVRSSEPLTAVVDGELVMLDARSSSYFGLDGIGTRIWELLEAPRSVDDVCTVLIEEYEVDPETCRTEVLAFITDLLDAQLATSS
jgi:hypothetical protein